ARLGGQEAVLREAPAPLKRPLGEGVWLQLSSAPPADPAALARLGEYLGPLLAWTFAELRAVNAAWDVAHPAPAAPVPPPEPPVPAALTAEADDAPAKSGRAVPVRRL